MEGLKAHAVDIDRFSNQILAMRGRLNLLLSQAQSNGAPAIVGSSFVPSVCKEVAVASEELEVALEELRIQNEQLNEALDAALVERYRYQQLFDSLPEAYLVTDLDGCIQEANSEAARLLGVSTKFLVGKPLPLFVKESDRLSFRKALLHHSHKASAMPWSFFLETRGQGTVHVTSKISVVTHETEEPIGLRWLISKTQSLQPEASGLVDPTMLEQSLLRSHVPLQYARGELISLTPKSLCYVVQGLVKLTTTFNNEDVLVGLVGPGIPFGPELTALPVYEAIALSRVQLITIPQSEIDSSPALAQLLLNKTNHRLKQAESLLAALGQRRVQDRLWQLLQLLKKDLGQSVDAGTRLCVRLTHEDLANACCSTRVTITRLLGKLQQQGKLSFDEKYHIILTD